ncbi:hypothetical protein FAZ15_19250 [Sphingobacterium olei]|uniref:DoxX family protein n=1 Tax=Sphingobacterium olei TaxID=2571155 RepID=A0A4U0NEN0_9SPHI|nr:hypothetical protein [Sphingobacterium olei]TJZ52527.1 hypothetical protein FAZ15_19250 [Sphingobacterium olei]
MKYRKITSWFMGVTMLMFGLLKFVNPFKSWFSVQIANSELGELSYTLGILGEIGVGTALILCLLYRQKIQYRIFNLITNASFFAVIVMMLIGGYVHLHSNVPADVLPLKIKPPYIPLFFLLLALSNIYLSIKRTTAKQTKRPNISFKRKGNTCANSTCLIDGIKTLKYPKSKCYKP